MAIPAVRVRIAFGSVPGDGEPVLSSWIDVSTYVRSVSTRVGRSQDLDRVEAGIATIELANEDARFTPFNTSSPYTGLMRPFTPIEVAYISDGAKPGPFMLGAARLGVSDATIYAVPPDSAVVFRGLVETWNANWFKPRGGVATIQAVDLFRYLALRTINTSYAQQTVGQRIAAVLSTAGNPFPTVIDAGGLTLAAGTVTANALQYLQDIAALDGGLFYCRGDGKIVYTSRDALAGLSSYTSVQAAIGDQAPEIPYQTITFGVDEQLVINQVTGKTSAGVSVTTENDTVSQSYYLVRPKDFGTTAAVNVSELQTRARRELVAKATARVKVEGLTFELRDTAVDSLSLTELEMTDRVSIARRPDQGAAFSGQFRVENIQHTVRPDRWMMSLGVSAAPPNFVLGVATIGTSAL